MANKINNWQELLKLANEDLAKYECKITLEEFDGSYTIYIESTATDKWEAFAEGYYEDELGDLINDAWSHARAKAKVAPQIVYRVSAYYDMNISAEEEILIEVYATEELAKQRVAQLIKKWKDGWKRTEVDADDWTEKEDSLEAYKDGEWNVDIFWMPEPIRNKID